MKINDKKGLQDKGRGYAMHDLELLMIMGIMSGFISVVVFSLYIDRVDVERLYSHPQLLWNISFLLLFWISRVWLITTRRKMMDDPIIFAIKDKNSYFIFLIIGLIMFLAS